MLWQGHGHLYDPWGEVYPQLPVLRGGPSARRPPDPEEAGRVAEAVVILGLRYAVVTSVTRDDLADGGASFFAETIRAIRTASPKTLVEVLIPDLQGNWQALQTIIDAGPDVLNHNIETVAGLYPKVRPQAEYERSLELLRQAKKICPQLPTKSGIMLGFGETHEELVQTWQDLLDVWLRYSNHGPVSAAKCRASPG